MTALRSDEHGIGIRLLTEKSPKVKEDEEDRDGRPIPYPVANGAQFF